MDVAPTGELSGVGRREGLSFPFLVPSFFFSFSFFILAASTIELHQIRGANVAEESCPPPYPVFTDVMPSLVRVLCWR